MSTWLWFKLSKKCKNSVKRSKIHEPEDSRLNLVILYSREDRGNQVLPDEWEKKKTKFKKIIISSNNIKSNKQQAAKTALLVLSKLTLRPSVPSSPLSPLSPWGKKKRNIKRERMVNESAGRNNGLFLPPQRRERFSPWSLCVLFHPTGNNRNFGQSMN